MSIDTVIFDWAARSPPGTRRCSSSCVAGGCGSACSRPLRCPHSDIPAVQQVPVDVHPDGVIQGLADLPGLIADW
ncbi:MAG: hypothetical protein H7Y15_17520 [Pseudonocardia sp.]|nr:hypothetical protein [Pseudonocardia sp.]